MASIDSFPEVGERRIALATLAGAFFLPAFDKTQDIARP